MRYASSAEAGAERNHVVDRLHDVRPEVGHQAHVARVAVVLADQPHELPAAVVLGHRVGAAAVDAARHLAVGELIARVPADEVADVGGEAHLEERRRGDRAVADPRPRVGARARLDRRPVTVDERVGERRLGVRTSSGAAGCRSRRARAGLPARRRRLLGVDHERAPARSWSAAERLRRTARGTGSRQHLAALAACEVEVPTAHPPRSRSVGSLRRPAAPACPQPVRRLLERGRAELVRRDSATIALLRFTHDTGLVADRGWARRRPPC
jgi:hypothetical protein